MVIKSTIGPWHGKGTPITEECTVWSGEKHLVALVPAHYDEAGRRSGTHCADARLIASAPDLLAALKGLVGAEAAYQSGSEEAGWQIDEYLKQARAAIAKAEGGK